MYKVRYNMGINFRNLGMLNESVDAFKKAVDLNERPAAYNLSGLSNFENENYSNAVKDFNEAIKKSKSAVAVHFNNRGLAFYHLNENQKALDDFSKALEINERDPNVLYNRGNVLMGLNRFNEARQDFDDAIRLQPTRPKYYHAKGLAFEAESILMEEQLLKS